MVRLPFERNPSMSIGDAANPASLDARPWTVRLCQNLRMVLKNIFVLPITVQVEALCSGRRMGQYSVAEPFLTMFTTAHYSVLRPGAPEHFVNGRPTKTPTKVHFS
jgi:hypothetical protein